MAKEGEYKRAQAAAKIYYNNLNRDAENLSKEQKSQIEGYAQTINQTY
jgi:hypothetical protein